MNLKIIIRETIEDSDFDWLREAPSFIPGKYFEEEDICFDTQGDDCKVNISDDETVFVLDYEDWRDKISEGFGDSDYIIEPLLENPNYDGGGDYYDFDDEEFNYAGYQMNPEQRERLQKIINLFSPDVNLENYLDDNLNELERVLTNKEIRDYWDTLKYRYLEIIGYQVQENRWKSIGDYYKTLTFGGENTYKIPVVFKKKSSRWGDEMEITVNTNDLINLLYQRNENDLSRALDILSAIITRPNWYDWFYEDWDTSGAEDEIRDAFNRFLDNTETYIEEESDDFTEQLEFYQMIKKLGFVNKRFGGDRWVKDIPGGGLWVISKIDFNVYRLKLEKRETDNMWVTPKEGNTFIIDFEELPVFLSQYRLDL
jgi:hypothetical protein